MLSLKIKKLHPKAVIPKYAKQGYAALDLVATEILEDDPGQITYGTGLAVEIPEGYIGLIFPRSSICKTELSLSNSVGVIDSGYRGEVKFVFNKRYSSTSGYYKPGDRVGQLIVLPYPSLELIEVESLSSSERGIGGYGSTGK